MTDEAIRVGRPVWPHAGVARQLAQAPERTVAALIAISLVVRTVLAMTLSLSADEAYGIGVAHDLQLSYFDHAPLSYWIIHFFEPLLGDGRALRLPFVVMFAATTWLLFVLTRQLFGARAGVWAVVALSLSGFFTLAGGWALPDGPLMLCLVAAAATIARSFFPELHRVPPSPWRTWIVAGLWIGLAGLSKYHAALFVAGLLVYVVASPRRWSLLRHPAPWVGAMVAVAVVMPIVLWNAQHHWASFAFQSARALHDGDFPKIDQFLTNLGGQFAYVLPWVLVPMLMAIGQAVRSGTAPDRTWYCLCTGLPIVLFFTVVALWAGRSFPHWEMPGWLLLYPVLGDYLAREATVRSRPRTWAAVSAVLLAAFAIMLVGYVETGFGKLLITTEDTRRDPALDFIEWTPLRDELQARGLLAKDNLFVVSGSPSDIGAIDQALGDALPMQVFGDAKEYAFRIDPKVLVGRDALIMGRRDRMGGVVEGLTPYFESIEQLPSFAFGRSGMKEIDVPIYYGHVLKKPLPLPRYARGVD
jgi:hypothetical protein